MYAIQVFVCESIYKFDISLVLIFKLITTYCVFSSYILHCKGQKLIIVLKMFSKKIFSYLVSISIDIL